jgi:uncharacterized protein with FMN-binding domain
MRTSTIKSIAAVALTGAGSALVLGFRTSDQLTTDSSAQVNTAANGSTAGSSSTGTTGTTGSRGSTTTPKPAPTTDPGSGSGSNAAYKDGTYTGQAVSEPWGPFQVQVVISNGSISSVSVVESPSDRHSSRINSQAVPLLNQSVMASAGTSVDQVSGATWTSESYAESLQSALDAAAKAA